jgi:hypothetical protein
MNPTHMNLLDLVSKQIEQLKIDSVNNPDDWINPKASAGKEVWKRIELEVLDYDQNLVTRRYKIHSDAQISVIKKTLDSLLADRKELLIMAPGTRDGESIGLVSEMNENKFREAIPAFYLYLDE